MFSTRDFLVYAMVFLSSLAVGLSVVSFIFILVGCIPSVLLGARSPGADTHKLSDFDVEYANAVDCAQGWVTGNAEYDEKEALAMLGRLGIRVQEVDLSGLGVGRPAATALRKRLLISDGFWDKRAESRVAILSHELVHYCQRRQLGNNVFDANILQSSGRWRVEIPAYKQTFVTRMLQCYPEEEVEKGIYRRIKTMRDTYWLHDIDAVQYEKESLAALLPALETSRDCG